MKQVEREFTIGASEVACRKAFLQFGEADAALIIGLRDRLREACFRFVDDFYDHLMTFDEMRALIPDDAMLARLKRMQGDYFDCLLSGEYGAEYIRGRLQIGATHQRIGLAPKWYIGAYGRYLCDLLPAVCEVVKEPDRFIETYRALLKVVMFDMGLAIDTYIQADQQAVAKVRDQLKNVIASVPLGMVLLDENLRVVSANVAFREILGNADAEFRGRPLGEILPEAGMAEWASQVLTGGVRQYQRQIDLIDLKGERRFQKVTIRGVRYHERDQARLLLMVEDITERYRAEEALLESEERFRQMAENIREVFWMTSTDKNNMIYISPAYREIWGISPEKLYRDPRSWLDAIHPGDRERVIASFPKQVTGEYDLEYRIIRPDGSLRWIRDRAFPIRNASGAVYRIAGIAEDVTDRKGEAEALQKAYQELQDAQAHLLQSEKMASLGQLAAGVAHEINNPVGFVSSNLRTLEEYTTDLLQVVGGYEALLAAVDRGDSGAASAEAGRVREIAKKIDARSILDDLSKLTAESIEGMERVRQIVQDLKNFSHVDEEERKPFDLNQGIESTLKIVWNEVKYKAEVVKEFGDLPELLCYPGQLNQVFMNVLVNAGQAIKERGKIWIRTFTRDGQIVVEVEDTGCGIPEENLKKIFDPFFTTKPVGKGTGLGLSVSYGIIRKHQGRIEVESTVGKGTTFRIILPTMGSEHPTGEIDG